MGSGQTGDSASSVTSPPSTPSGSVVMTKVVSLKSKPVLPPASCATIRSMALLVAGPATSQSNVPEFGCGVVIAVNGPANPFRDNNRSIEVIAAGLDAVQNTFT